MRLLFARVHLCNKNGAQVSYMWSSYDLLQFLNRLARQEGSHQRGKCYSKSDYIHPAWLHQGVPFTACLLAPHL